MQSIMIPCAFDGVTAHFPFFVGQPAAGCDPLDQQLAWLERERGGRVVPEVVGSFAELNRIAREQSVPLEDLVAHAMKEARLAPSPDAALPWR